ncbi:hypothetical protein GCM10023176_54850 [Micromonospora coerulea]|uniref:Uncharacterized protein n=1 Tax=Micromonospora coerulea TaxID=47856 RepID=A0ABP8SZI7_9ACTN
MRPAPTTDLHTQPQLAYADLPASVHLTVTAAVAPPGGRVRPGPPPFPRAVPEPLGTRRRG